MSAPPTAPTVHEIVALYERWGADHYDEDLSQLDHALQTAALAEAAGAEDTLVAAALLHDVGHLLAMADGVGGPPPGEDLHHETRGARYLAGRFPPEVTGPIALHVRAKRYRVSTDPAYAGGLSAGSTRSLALQGGPLEPDEVLAFDAHPGAADALALRDWDDQGKVTDLEVPPFDHYRDLLTRLARP